jgi:hypothetical protein
MLVINIDEVVHERLFTTKPIEELFTGLIVFHPFVFYWSIVYIFIIICRFRVLYLLKLNSNGTLVVLAFIALLSGGYWGFLQLNWNGWWTWDSVDFLLFFFVLVCTRNAHEHYQFVKKTPFILFMIITFITILLIRFGLFSSKHTFFDMKYTAFHLSFAFKFIVPVLSIFSMYTRSLLVQPWPIGWVVNLTQAYVNSITNLTLLVCLLFMLMNTVFEGLSLSVLIVLIVLFIFIFGKKIIRIDLKNKKLIYHSILFIIVVGITLTMEPYTRFFFVYYTASCNLAELQICANQMLTYSSWTGLTYYFDFITILSETYSEYDFEDWLQQEYTVETSFYPVTFVLDRFNLSNFTDSNSVIFDFLSIFIFGIFINTLILYPFYFIFK